MRDGSWDLAAFVVKLAVPGTMHWAVVGAPVTSLLFWGLRCQKLDSSGRDNVQRLALCGRAWILCPDAEACFQLRR